MCAVAAEVVAEKSLCERLFVQESLVCSTCDFIEKEQPELTSLADACRTCCGNDGTLTYVSAQLSLDKRQLHWLPELGNFVKEGVDSFGSKLKVKYSSNTRPTLHMKQANGDVDKVSIGTWKSDQISKYLTAKLSK